MLHLNEWWVTYSYVNDKSKFNGWGIDTQFVFESQIASLEVWSRVSSFILVLWLYSSPCYSSQWLFSFGSECQPNVTTPVRNSGPQFFFKLQPQAAVRMIHSFSVICDMAWRYRAQVTNPPVQLSAGAKPWTYIPAGCWPKERTLYLQSTSIEFRFNIIWK